MGYIDTVIENFKHKGLEEFFNTGIKKGIQPGHAPKLERILDRLAAARNPLDMGLPGFKLHELSGNKAGTWAVSVSGNWRVTFKFKGKNAVKVDYEDYH
jgi:proteic killer suppression protein